MPVETHSGITAGIHILLAALPAPCLLTHDSVVALGSVARWVRKDDRRVESLNGAAVL